MTDLGCKHVCNGPRHPLSNGLAENFIHILKCAIYSANPHSFLELGLLVDNFPIKYRNAAYTATGSLMTFKSSSLRVTFECILSANVDLKPANGIVI